MSECYVQVAEIERLSPHTNADSLELAQILGWQMVVRKGEYQEKDRIVFFPPDTILPDAVAERFEVKDYLGKGNRVRQIRLRGEPSFGLAVAPDDPAWELGQNVADYYGATKYEPPVRQTGGRGAGGGPTDTLPEHPLFPRYTSIENLRNYPRVLQAGEPVWVSEKLHGTNVRVGLIEGDLYAGSHRLSRKIADNATAWLENFYVYPLALPTVRHLLHLLGRAHRQVILYGEVYGDRVQSFSYGKIGTLGYRAFDLLLDGKFVDWSEFLEICAHYGVETVPNLGLVSFSLESIKALSEGTTDLMAENAHIREGVVVRPEQERSDPRIGRVILKYLSDAYLLMKGRSDYTEV